MVAELTFESLLSEIDAFLKLPQSDIVKASERSIALSRIIGTLQNVVKLDSKRASEMSERISVLDANAVKLAQSAINYRRGGVLSADWARFAQRDLRRFKDELMAFREFVLANSDLFKSSIGTHKLSSDINMARLIRELHDAQAIGERTFVLLTNYIAQNSGAKIKCSEAIAQLSRISAYLSELHEIRKVGAGAQQK
jgi:histidyl-tRNA synthetase